MSELMSNNKTLMRRIYEEMWNQGRPVLAAEIFEQPQGVERFVSQFLLSFPDLQHVIDDMIVDGDQIAVRFSAHGTHTGAWMHFTPTGRFIQYTGVTWARIAANRIMEHYTWWDKAGLIKQIGG
ncbi:MAG TPA: ester cyclase [Anaerolineales bacterium]|nr:ester cyclase [Anaerolineales bacterium]